MGCTRVPSGLLGLPSWRCAPVVKSATTPFIGWRKSLIGLNSVLPDGNPRHLLPHPGHGHLINDQFITGSASIGRADDARTR